MVWFKLDDQSTFHSKVVQVGNEAWGAFCRAGTFTSSLKQDGFLTENQAKLIAKPKIWKRLLEANLIEKVACGYQIHDFLLYNPSSKEAEAKSTQVSEKRSKAGKAGAAKRWQTDGKRDGKPMANVDGNCHSDGIANGMAKNGSRPDPIRSIKEPPTVPHGGTVGLELVPTSEPARVSKEDQVFEYWKSKHKPKAKKTRDRMTRIKARLKEGYSVEDLSKAVDGVFEDSFLMGENIRQTEYRDIKTIFRDGAKVEALMELADQAEADLHTREPCGISVNSPIEEKWAYFGDPPGTVYCDPPEGFFEKVRELIGGKEYLE